jgi:hypothetical protein
MSLNDLDKDDDHRRFPKPNANDNVPHRMAHGTTQHTYRQVNSDVVPRMQFLNGLIVTYDENNKVSSVYGYIPEVSNTPVFIIANEGDDVFEDILDITAPTV